MMKKQANKFKALFLGLAMTILAVPAMAATCSGQSSLGNLGPPGLSVFGNSFSGAGSFVDCYSFSLNSGANTFGGTLEVDLFSYLNIDVTSASLFSGGVSGGSTTGSLLGSDVTPTAFSFGSLAAGIYTLAVAGNVSRGGLGLPFDVGYAGSISSVSAVSPIPEPEIYAMLGVGLGLIGWAQRRKKKAA